MRGLGQIGVIPNPRSETRSDNLNFRVQLEGTTTHYWRYWQAKRDFRVKPEFNLRSSSLPISLWDDVAYEGIPSTHRTFKKFNQNLFVFSNETEPDLSARGRRHGKGKFKCNPSQENLRHHERWTLFFLTRNTLVLSYMRWYATFLPFLTLLNFSKIPGPGPERM